MCGLLYYNVPDPHFQIDRQAAAGVLCVGEPACARSSACLGSASSPFDGQQSLPLSLGITAEIALPIFGFPCAWHAAGWGRQTASRPAARAPASGCCTANPWRTPRPAPLAPGSRNSWAGPSRRVSAPSSCGMPASLGALCRSCWLGACLSPRTSLSLPSPSLAAWCVNVQLAVHRHNVLLRPRAFYRALLDQVRPPRQPQNACPCAHAVGLLGKRRAPPAVPVTKRRCQWRPTPRRGTSWSAPGPASLATQKRCPAAGGREAVKGTCCWRMPGAQLFNAILIRAMQAAETLRRGHERERQPVPQNGTPLLDSNRRHQTQLQLISASMADSAEEAAQPAVQPEPPAQVQVFAGLDFLPASMDVPGAVASPEAGSATHAALFASRPCCSPSYSLSSFCTAWRL